ncbi:hypothetical protein FH972_025251 [Carpinus fangiana]|uniref:Heme haloperoxidase family profile domain-containing protein n=1 Tax=Carpinus fangiana TaxID=176857 RepID=A0A5N6L0R2_9ROSI|nr:hypothetical protein FH972_025251 [Carpinus fangiana]
MKLLALSTLAIQGAVAFPSLMGKVDEAFQPDKRAAYPAGCSVSKLCNTRMDISDSEIGYNAKAKTPAQVASAARNNCGAQNPTGCTSFNAKAQYVSTSGEHAYADPAPDEIRGPCPGLNAAANHAYLPRSGIASLPQTVDGMNAAFGMFPDLSGFLAAYAIVFNGDLLTQTWSIGGPPPSTTIGSGLLGKPQGISWSHNKYEGDSSIGRCDAYINGGDAHSLSVERFKYAYVVGMDNDRYTLDKFAREFTKNSFRSIRQNPNYFAPLFSTTLVSPAAYNFVVNLMSNRTAAEPNGYLDGEIFKTFFGVSGTYPNFKWLPGKERIPENWYRRPSENGYNAVGGVFGDLAAQFLAYPVSFRFGGNANGVDTYTGIDIADFTNGAMHLDDLSKPENLACLAYQSVQQAVPDFATGGLLQAATKVLNPALAKAFGGLACPRITKFNNNNLNGYPGHSYSPTGPATTC